MTYIDFDFNARRDEINLSNNMKLKIKYYFDEGDRLSPEDMFHATHRKITLFDKEGNILNETIEENPYKTD